ncbi:MAG TPA: pseudouridine-5'-phosphate glycosidase, partial [Candidatus Dormibacteraeota bacterium]|nr:pseudouridine-5'-phosphate glycosidase [Candidatus Dormibacteraeota bacterium]
MSALSIAPAVRDAIASGAAVVALESAVITHGLPRPAAIDAVRRQWEACEKA